MGLIVQGELASSSSSAVMVYTTGAGICMWLDLLARSRELEGRGSGEDEEGREELMFWLRSWSPPLSDVAAVENERAGEEERPMMLLVL